MWPTIGITSDVLIKDDLRRVMCTQSYIDAVDAAGGVAIVLPHIEARIDDYLRLCDGFILTGGDDPATEPFGEPTHPQTTPVDPQRQTFETALLAALDRTAHPVMGICLGMQMMALHHGGRLHQHLPESHPQLAAAHDRATHAVRRVEPDAALPSEGQVFSRHHQAVADAGRLRVCGRSVDGLIEAIDAPGKRFYLGVQWHPERTAAHDMGAALFQSFLAAAREFAAGDTRNQRT